MTHNLIAAVDAAMVEMQNIHPPLKRSECERLIRAALSAPAEPVSGEAVAYVDSSWIAQVRGIGCTVRKAFGTSGHDLIPIYTAPPSPDAELVELLIDARKGLDNVGRQDLYINYEGVSKIKGRIDAKLAILK